MFEHTHTLHLHSLDHLAMVEALNLGNPYQNGLGFQRSRKGFKYCLGLDKRC